MSGTAVQGQPSSQLGAYRRIRLMIRNPRDAFALLSASERKRDAVVVSCLYLVVRLPVVLQKMAAKGTLDPMETTSLVLSVMTGMLVSLVLGAALLLLLGLLLHGLLNFGFRCGRTLPDALTLPFLSLAPQLVLAVEFPSLLLNFHAQQTFLLFVFLRIIVDILSVRTFYWGLRVLFGLTKGKAVAFSWLPFLLFFGVVIVAPQATP